MVPTGAVLALLVGCGPDATGLASPATTSTVANASHGSAPDPTVAEPETTDPTSDRAAADPAPIGTVPDPVPAPDTGDVSSDRPAVASVAIVGDSLTLSATEEITDALARTGLTVVAVDGVENRRIAGGVVEPGVDAVQRLVAAGVDPDLWVVALGTNDVGAQIERARLRVDIARLLAGLPAHAHVIWVDTHVSGRPQLATEMNSLIRTMTSYDPQVSVADWNTPAADAGVLVADGVHLTPAGQERFADVIVDEVRQRFDVVGAAHPRSP